MKVSFLLVIIHHVFEHVDGKCVCVWLGKSQQCQLEYPHKTWKSLIWIRANCSPWNFMLFKSENDGGYGKSGKYGKIFSMFFHSFLGEQRTLKFILFFLLSSLYCQYCSMGIVFVRLKCTKSIEIRMIGNWVYQTEAKSGEDSKKCVVLR